MGKWKSVDRFFFFSFLRAVEIKEDEKLLTENEKKIIELVKKEREKEIDFIRVKEYVKPIEFPYKKVVKVYEKPIGILSFFFFEIFDSLVRSIDRSIDRCIASNARGFPRSPAHVKFPRYRGNHDQVPIIKPVVREARLDHAPRFESHEESYRVSNDSCQTSSRLVWLEHCTLLFRDRIEINFLLLSPLIHFCKRIN